MTAPTVLPKEFVIHYHLTKKDGRALDYKIALDESTLFRTNVVKHPQHAQWTQMECNRCQICLNDSAKHPDCPAAVAISEIIDDWADAAPHDRVVAECHTPNRSINTTTTAQVALSSLLGLILASSECAYFNFFRPMARFHLPFSTVSESFFRVFGTYFIGAYFRDDLKTDHALEDIQVIYTNLEHINQSLAARINDLPKSTATTSALVILDSLAKLFTMDAEDSMQQLKALFESSKHDKQRPLNLAPETEKDTPLLRN